MAPVCTREEYPVPETNGKTGGGRNLEPFAGRAGGSGRREGRNAGKLCGRADNARGPDFGPGDRRPAFKAEAGIRFKTRRPLPSKKGCGGESVERLRPDENTGEVPGVRAFQGDSGAGDPEGVGEFRGDKKRELFLSDAAKRAGKPRAGTKEGVLWIRRPAIDAGPKGDRVKGTAKPPLGSTSEAKRAAERIRMVKTKERVVGTRNGLPPVASAFSETARSAAGKAARKTAGREIRKAAGSRLVFFAGGAAVLLMLLCPLLFGGAFFLTDGDGSGGAAAIPVSAEVEAYGPQIRQYAKEEGILDYVELIQAVMMQESGGCGEDPMQASECAYNTRYPRRPGGISDPDYSIRVGIQNLAACFAAAGVQSPLDLTRIRLALQGYNFGNGYISWAQANYGGYSYAGAVEFSVKQAEKYG